MLLIPWYKDMVSIYIDIPKMVSVNFRLYILPKSLTQDSAYEILDIC